MKMFKVEDGGASHWVVANTREEAIGLTVQHGLMQGASLKELVGDDGFSAEAMHPHATFTYNFQSGNKLTAAVYEWLELFGVPQYVACTDY